MTSVSYLPLFLPQGASYRCPGESYDIGYSVHLARIAAGFPACRNCPQRGNSGELPVHQLAWLDRSGEQKPQSSLFTADGVRGIYLNDLNRISVGRLAGAFARLLWERHPPRLKSPSDEQETSTVVESKRSVPLVLVGHDERSHSPDLQQGAVQILRRMSCQVLDAGQIPVPWFERLMSSKKATAGLYLGGAGESPAWSGMKFWVEQGVPCSRDYLLPEIEAAYEAGIQRPSRSSSGYRTVRQFAEYEAGMRHLFHALRPLKIVVGSASSFGEELLRRLLSTTACELIFEKLPRRRTVWSKDEDSDRAAIASLIRERGAHLGCLIGEDWQEMVCLDEKGKEVPFLASALFAAGEVLIEDREAPMVLAEGLPEEFATELRNRGARVMRAAGSRPAIVRAMHEQGAKLGISENRLWFQDGGVTCDSMLLLGMTLQAMSRSDRELSQLVESLRPAGFSSRRL